MSDIRCQMSDVRCQMSDVTMLVSDVIMLDVRSDYVEFDFSDLNLKSQSQISISNLRSQISNLLGCRGVLVVGFRVSIFLRGGYFRFRFRLRFRYDMSLRLLLVEVTLDRVQDSVDELSGFVG